MAGFRSSTSNPRQQASQDAIERVLLLHFPQGFVLAEHEGSYSSYFLDELTERTHGRTHGAFAALVLCRTAIVQIWPCYARSSSGIQEHDCQPYFLALCGALLQVAGSSCHLKGKRVLCCWSCNHGQCQRQSTQSLRASQGYWMVQAISSRREPDSAEEKDLCPRVIEGPEG